LSPANQTAGAPAIRSIRLYLGLNRTTRPFSPSPIPNRDEPYRAIVDLCSATIDPPLRRRPTPRRGAAAQGGEEPPRKEEEIEELPHKEERSRRTRRRRGAAAQGGEEPLSPTVAERSSKASPPSPLVRTHLPSPTSSFPSPSPSSFPLSASEFLQ
jgi:hypothetical protein